LPTAARRSDGRALVQLDALRAFDVALDFPCHHDRARAHGAREVRAGLDGQRAVDVDVALEAAGNAYVAGAVDLAFEREARGNDGFLEFPASRRRTRRG
jgi:hypothetical protein